MAPPISLDYTAPVKPFRPEELLGPLNEHERVHAPAVLYAAGHRDWLLEAVPRVSIVGARQASPDGLRRATKLATQLVEQGVTIVSGLAKGIDAAAHVAALEREGRTIAVIGTPLTEVYPREHRALQARLATEHLVLSQFPPNSPVQRHNFPLRNRTMALISHASVIVEATESSGSLSQGWEALRLGRPLFLARSVFDQGLQWPEQMMAYGAMVLEQVDDVLDVLPRSSVDDLLAAIA